MKYPWEINSNDDTSLSSVEILQQLAFLDYEAHTDILNNTNTDTPISIIISKNKFIECKYMCQC